ncbi:MAG: ATP-binding cassette domain-containing protein, partial [Propionibacteriaceae bacterium]|nr:ATP-binding cassette domain-containing protein [Propionibacteriaceae bacterium]
IVVEHRVDVWLPLIDRVIVLSPDGGVSADGHPDEVFAAQGEELARQGVWVPGIPLQIDQRCVSGPMLAMRRAPAGPGRPDAVLDAQSSGWLRSAGVCAVASPNRRSARPIANTSFDGPGALILRGVDLTIGYQAGRPVMEHLDVDIPAGVSTVITGPNGVGKSTLALTLAGLLPQLGGRVEASDDLRPAGPESRHQKRLIGRDATTLADPHSWTSRQLLTRLGTVFQQPEHQFVTASVRAELAVGLRALGWPAPAVEARVDELLGLLHLDGLASANPFTLSGGEKRRLSVGTVLACGPQVIILDEPTFGQDRATWCDLVQLIRTLLDQGCTVVSVTHDQQLMDVLGENRIDLGAAS